MSFLPFLHRVCSRQDLPAVEAQEAMSLILEGFATTPQIAAFLSALHTKGETSDELYGFALAMRERSAPIPHGVCGETILDTCGTGDNSKSHPTGPPDSCRPLKRSTHYGLLKRKD